MRASAGDEVKRALAVDGTVTPLTWTSFSSGSCSLTALRISARGKIRGKDGKKEENKKKLE